MIAMSFFAWMAIDRAIMVPGSSTWMVPIISVSVFFVIAYVNSIIIQNKVYLSVLFLLTYLTSFVFVLNFLHLIGFGIAYLFTYWAVARIKQDLSLNVKISIWKSVRAGSGLFIFAVASIITSQYYLTVKDLNTERLIPQFYISSITGNLTTRFLTVTNPEIKNIAQENLTIDQFILQTQKGELQTKEVSLETNAQIDQMIQKTNPSATEAQKKILKEDALQKVKSASLEMGKEQEGLLLSEGRKKFSEMSGMVLQGDEKMADVLANIVNRKIDQYFGAGTDEDKKTSTLPYVMAIVLLLTILPLGSVLNTFWMILTQLLIWIFMKAGIVAVRHITIEAEVLE
jgi:hypothetical protein